MKEKILKMLVNRFENIEHYCNVLDHIDNVKITLNFYCKKAAVNANGYVIYRFIVDLLNKKVLICGETKNSELFEELWPYDTCNGLENLIDTGFKECFEHWSKK